MAKNEFSEKVKLFYAPSISAKKMENTIDDGYGAVSESGGGSTDSMQLNVINTKWELWTRQNMQLWVNFLLLSLSSTLETQMDQIVPTWVPNLHLKDKIFSWGSHNIIPPILLWRTSANGTYSSQLTTFNLTNLTCYISICILCIQ